jgi:hypothetical protein
MLQEVLEEIKKQMADNEKLLGLLTYLTLASEYLSAFTGGKSLLGKIESLAYVVFFLRLWSLWLQSDSARRSGLTLDKNGVTVQTRMDVELSAAAVINVGAWCSEQGIEVDTSLLGSDIVETFWYVANTL